MAISPLLQHISLFIGFGLGDTSNGFNSGSATACMFGSAVALITIWERGFDCAKKEPPKPKVGFNAGGGLLVNVC